MVCGVGANDQVMLGKACLIGELKYLGPVGGIHTVGLRLAGKEARQLKPAFIINEHYELVVPGKQAGVRVRGEGTFAGEPDAKPGKRHAEPGLPNGCLALGACAGDVACESSELVRIERIGMHHLAPASRCQSRPNYALLTMASEQTEGLTLIELER